MSVSATSTVTKSLSLNEVRARVAKFVIDYTGVTSERQSSGDFWRAFMRCYGVDDTFLEGIRFEYPARRASTKNADGSGGQGYIDVFKPGVYLIEQKTTGKIRTRRGKTVSTAEEQAFDYINGGDITDAMRPRWVVTSDFATIQVTDLSEPVKSPTRTITFPFSELNDYVELFWFLTGDEDIDAKIREEQAEASVKAARLMGDLYAAMTHDADIENDDPSDEDEDDATQEASILLTRLLFLMFGDDAGLWDRGLFQRFVKNRTSDDGSDLGQLLRSLFEVLDMKKRPDRVDEAMAAFPYINGQLYKDAHKDKTVFFDTAMRDALLAACDFDWSRISPAVFGSLFQTVKSKSARRGAGEHYTSEENILKTLRPMFLDDFRKRLDAADSKPKLEALHEDLRNFRYVDPACGCGNFLIVAYREMRALELDLLVKWKTLAGREGELMLDPTELLHVSLDQFYGIELHWWPAKIAETAMWLVDHQANQKMRNTLGMPLVRLPIDIKANIHHGNALTTDWNTILPVEDNVTVFVFGNPPFLGHYTRNEQQANELAAAWGTAKTGLDFVTGWHAKAMDYLAERKGDFAFVTTNSICQGDSVADLFSRIDARGWRIKFAHRTFAWNSEAASKDKAAVHCVIVGFTRDTVAKARLFSYANIKAQPDEVRVSTGINGYLVDAPNVYVTSRTAPLAADLPPVAFGSMPNDGRGLLVSADQYHEVADDPIAAKYLRRFIGADELINNKQRWCLWLVDAPAADIAASPVLRARVQAVKKTREDSTRPTTRDLAASPHLFGEIRQPDVPYLCIPRHFSESRPYATVARLEPEVIAGDATFTCPDPDGFGFAIISSSMFMTWQKTVGGRLKSDPRFAAGVVWNTLPLPAVTPAVRTQIIAAASAVLDARATHPERSLADHYQPLAMDPELVKAHRALDKVVDKAFGAFPTGRVRRLTEADRQQVLFDRYTELATAATTVA